MKPSALFLLCCGELVWAGSHSLWYFGTLQTGQAQFPEFVVVGMVDDVQVEYYDSDIGKMISRRHWRPDAEVEEADNKVFAAKDHHFVMRDKLQILMSHLNHTGGHPTFQVIAGCELDDDGSARFMSREGYDGRDAMNYNTKSYSYTLLIPGVVMDKAGLQVNKLMTDTFYQPLCVRILKSYLQQERTRLMRRVKPRVRVFQKTSALSGGTEVTCLATGFYPRALELTLLRDGRPVPEQELTGGEVLPNGDGTYQLRKSLALSEEEEERRGRHRYTCRVQHSGLDNRLEVDWEPEPDLDTGLIAGVVIGVLIVVLVLPVAACVLWRKKGRGAQSPACRSSDVKYTEAQGQEQSETSSNSSGQ
ncbi:RLA class I histocompatibility antigen, alpha chain 11/11-like [Lepisosteus oculatus]|uniref:RLA class I histocompatibility antigen, alpha chain 11/11-like n=1 Tax=Lepisosteus oculatus TaxID=7918 RepID=UPI0035F51CEC